MKCFMDSMCPTAHERIWTNYKVQAHNQSMSKVTWLQLTIGLHKVYLVNYQNYSAVHTEDTL